jgi:hypothetical protein
MMYLVGYDETLDVAHGHLRPAAVLVGAGLGHAIDPDTGRGVCRAPIHHVFTQQTWPDINMTAAACPHCLELTAD